MLHPKSLKINEREKNQMILLIALYQLRIYVFLFHSQHMGFRNYSVLKIVAYGLEANKYSIHNISLKLAMLLLGYFLDKATYYLL